MLALIVALFWLAILIPWGIVKFRNSRSEKSIDSFHAEHEVLSRQAYSVAPARRLDDAYLYEEYAYEPEHAPERSRPRLTVVQDDDTYSSLESRVTWDEWERDYDYDEPRMIGTGPDHGHHRYAAYASAPSPYASAPAPYASAPAPYVRAAQPQRATPSHQDPIRVSMMVRRRRIFACLTVSAIVTTGLDFLVGLSLLQYLAVLSWVTLVAYVAVALFAVSLGFIAASSLVGRRTTRAYMSFDVNDGAGRYADETYDEPRYAQAYDEPFYDDQEHRNSRRYALG
ncbi:MAG TPA: hypothetical protein VIJ86_05470 [Acidimicrobiales bacterium]